MPRYSHRRPPMLRRARAVGCAALVLTFAALSAGLGACAGARETPADTAASASTPPAADTSAGATAAAPDAAGDWQPLFDGTDLRQWRGYQRQTVPAAWRVENGALAFIPVAEQDARGDLMSREQFGDFELEYEWRVVPGANSGVMWRVSEDRPRPWHTGPEMQVLDDARHTDGRIPSHRAGALYDLVVPPPDIARPVGEYNQARVVVRGSRVQLHLNGRQTADVDFESEAGRQLVAKSKFDTLPGFARNPRGHIVLQDHGDTVYYRNIRVRALPAGGR
jgi:hypothetical protein